LVSNRCFPLFFSPCLRHLQADAPTFPPSDTGCPQRRGRRQLFRHGELLRRLGHPLAKSDGFLDGESQGYVQMVSFFLVLLSINGLLVSFFPFCMVLFSINGVCMVLLWDFLLWEVCEEINL
jgi:hypothetical protein